MGKIATVLGITMWVAAVIPASDGGSRLDALRAKLSVLEAQIASKKTLVRQNWKDVARLDRLIAAAAPPAAEAPAPGPDEVSSGSERAGALLQQSYDRASLESERLQVLQGIVAAYKEIAFLEEEARTTRGQVGRRPVMEGDWALTILPMGARGEFSLNQNGTLVDGVYIMESGLTGNVQGTLINGQITLERIDSKYGKMGRLEGQVSKDGSRIQGSWYSYDVQSGNPLTGSFTLERIEGPGE
jgi:hypothetical protein